MILVSQHTTPADIRKDAAGVNGSNRTSLELKLFIGRHQLNSLPFYQKPINPKKR